jgi:hypothetical protein
MTLVLDEKLLSEFVKNGEYLHTHYNELLKKYDHQYVAIKNQKVFRYAKTVDELESLLKKEKIELGTILTEFIRDKRNFM